MMRVESTILSRMHSWISEEDESLILNLNSNTTNKKELKDTNNKYTNDTILEEKTKDEKLSDKSIQRRRIKDLYSSIDNNNDSSGTARNRPNSVVNRRNNCRQFSQIDQDNQLTTGRNTNKEDKPIKPKTRTNHRLRFGKGLYSNTDNKPVYFNLMCIGKEKTGKSKFLEELIEKVFHKKKIIERDEHKIVEYISEKKDYNHNRFIMTCIDTKGYSATYPADRWFSDVEQHILGKVGRAES